VGLRIAIDANRYVDYARGVPDAVMTLQRASEVYLPFVVLGELRAGFLGGSQKDANEANLIRFLGREAVYSLHTDDDTAHHYARIYQQLRRQGTPIPSNDIWIASLTVQHNLALYSRDAHFDRLPQLARV